MPSTFRILVQTHHMTSRRKIYALTKAAKSLGCGVILKVGRPPGIMLAEGERALQWLDLVKQLRYKDYRLLKKELIAQPLLDVPVGRVVEVTSVKELSTFLRTNTQLYEWWRLNMGFKKDPDAP
ncbi:unnamed protein product [Blumeria hordei]|uniref:Uncharacterized protein n=2 Tax=Blumeria hordei TaxID=2867405 RepID=A0A383UZS3_BLUHO|nr:hypothetical protein BGHDH14_bgh04606 [Blumeria hordei DH14]SZF04792.1 unnamed protein product [Blumeria hordei]